MTRHTSTALSSAALLALALVACHPDERTAQGIAERFVDQYYVQINLAGAKPLCAGLATKKLEEEERLTAGQAIDESTHKPMIRYKLLDDEKRNEQNPQNGNFVRRRHRCQSLTRITQICTN